MRTFIFLLFNFLVINISFVYAQEKSWSSLPGCKLNDIYKYGSCSHLDKIQSKFESKIVGTSGLSWPDGRQLITTLIEVIVYHENDKSRSKNLYRCDDFFDKDMQHSGQMCYESVGR
ncbi:hypothetical protein [Solidesulfovibrio magneticus]|uniref:Uncharacterized protein n=1 Tax=Solidesulfovibrio magneticus (strain ATCC 700980 / DSM 13731 / RS-1) TaxID=573370 RepID=C4XJH1_SOLM1|nr:hypothetical protein [Solidesulfovibrio magneticus]BAH76721.1 hypothetical protein DMR_32300 [Solidesulfovibrio magneticus RS-1]